MTLKIADPKDPNEVLDYTHDWSAVLVGGDAVVGPPEALVVSGGVMVDSTSMLDATTQKYRLSGGVIGTARLTLRIATTSGQSFDEGVVLKIKER